MRTMSTMRRKKKRGHGPVYVDGGSVGGDEERGCGEGAGDRGSSWSVMSFEMFEIGFLFNNTSERQTCMHTRLSPSGLIYHAILSAHVSSLLTDIYCESSGCNVPSSCHPSETSLIGCHTCNGTRNDVRGLGGVSDTTTESCIMSESNSTLQHCNSPP